MLLITYYHKKSGKELGCIVKQLILITLVRKNLIKIINAHDELITNSGVLIFYALSEEAKKKIMLK